MSFSFKPDLPKRSGGKARPCTSNGASWACKTAYFSASLALACAAGCTHAAHPVTGMSPQSRDASSPATQPATAKPPSAASADQPPARPRVRCLLAGWSVEDRPLIAWEFGDARGGVFVFAGIHGDETASFLVARRLVEFLQTDCPPDAAVVVLAEANPDGIDRGTRCNARGVDLNRNFPASNWRPNGVRHGLEPASEPETRAILNIMEFFEPRLVISIHCIHGGRECNNYDGPAEAAAEVMSRYNGYHVKVDIGYPTPGSFGSWAGVDCDIPVITLELPRLESGDHSWARNHAALMAILTTEALTAADTTPLD